MTGFSLYAYPGHLIRRLQQIAVSIFVDHAKPYGITPVQYAALVAIDAYPGLDQRQLSRVIAFDRSTIGDVVDRLERKALITREAKPHDRRTKALVLTSEGTALLERMRGAVLRSQEDIMAPLGPEERATFMALLAKLVDANNELSRVPLEPFGR